MIANNIHQEKQYISLVQRIISHGEMKKGRNGFTKSLFGAQMRFDLRNNTLPLLTTKKVAWKTCLKELLWFIEGDTNNKRLKDQNVKIWNPNGSREFLDSRGLTHYEEDDLGPVYGHQWRYFNAPYSNCHQDYTSKGIDQLQYIVDALKGTHPTENKNSRRLIVSAWNPCQLNEMALPPCHVLFQFYVNDKDELSCSLYQRSGDIGLGVPFNIASYAFLTHIMAKHCDLKTGEFIHTIGDCHIYDDHIEPLTLQCQREPYTFPKVNVIKTHDFIDQYSINDLEITDYNYHDKITMDMRA